MTRITATWARFETDRTLTKNHVLMLSSTWSIVAASGKTGITLSFSGERLSEF